MNENDLHDLARALYERASLSGFPKTASSWADLSPSQRGRWLNLAMFAWLEVKSRVLDGVAQYLLERTQQQTTTV